jgi:thioredoxin-related protein
MRRLFSRVLLIGCLLILAAGAGLVLGQDKATSPGSYDGPDFDGSADANRQITDAVGKARKEGNRILLQFGANSCLSCLTLHRVFMTEKTVSAEVAKDYVLVLVDVSKGYNQGIVKRCAYATLAVLDADGKLIITQNSGEFADGSYYDLEKVLAFLKEWAPKRSG